MRVLESSKLFAGLPAADLERLRGCAQVREYPADAVIFSEGDQGDGVYLIRHGEVQVSAMVGNGESGVLSRLGPGEFFGEMAALDSEPRSATVTAKAPTSVYFIPRQDLLAMLETSPKLAASLAREFSLRMRDFNRQYIREVLQAERLAVVGRFARSIVHDFKNPLNIIGIAAELAGMEKVSATARDSAVLRIRKQVQRLTNMINELLEFTRGSKTQVVLGQSHYPTFVRNLMAELQPEIEERGVELKWATEIPDVYLLLDPHRLTHVFYNLVQNAVDAMAGKGVLELGFSCNDREVVTEFRDSGKGIAPEVFPRLFEAFATFGKSNGTGLGLSICRRVIEDHGGKIEARNHPAGGAVLMFTLPLASDPAAGFSNS